jgi:hypothetical protein
MTTPPATTSMIPTAETLLDREAIREVMARYCRGIDRLDVELIKSAYHPDAFDDHGPFKGLRDDFVEWIVPTPTRSSAGDARPSGGGPDVT